MSGGVSGVRCERCPDGEASWYPETRRVYGWCRLVHATWSASLDDLPERAPHWCPRVLRPMLPGMEMTR